MSYDDPYGDSMGQRRSGGQKGGGRQGPPADYVEVNQRVIEFHEHYPQGVIWTEIIESIGLVIGDDVPRIAIRAFARRNPGEDPFTGMSWLEIPGKTPYTKGSEIENAETSAVGRALAFMGIAAKQSLASLDEILSKREDTGASPSPSSGSEDPNTSQSPPAGTEGKEDTTEAAGEDKTAKPAAKPKRKSRAKAKPKAKEEDPAINPDGERKATADTIDQQTGEITGLTKEQFHQRMRDELIPKGLVVPIFTDLFGDQDPATATAEQRMAVLNEAIARREAAK